jgi:hypothetical protein
MSPFSCVSDAYIIRSGENNVNKAQSKKRKAPIWGPVKPVKFSFMMRLAGADVGIGPCDGNLEQRDKLRFMQPW